MKYYIHFNRHGDKDWVVKTKLNDEGTLTESIRVDISCWTEIIKDKAYIVIEAENCSIDKKFSRFW